MKTAENIQTQIKTLPHGEYRKLAHWFSEQDWKAWDKEIEKDSQAGRLDFLIEEALDEKQARKLRGL
ncbi:MAG: hypothetical protein LGR52_15475 [Candidatus Thiosymbion ectosymbiont of Robbea hypermnestra]|nr:hypothetical protein [Candidatus Thiosymbion ectosymbiont of Robbea hypermnestra]